MQKVQTPCLNNNCYNIIHQLTKTSGFLSRADRYLQDANEAGDKEAAKVWQTIKADREKHANLLRELIINEIKNNKF